MNDLYRKGGVLDEECRKGGQRVAKSAECQPEDVGQRRPSSRCDAVQPLINVGTQNSGRPGSMPDTTGLMLASR